MNDDTVIDLLRTTPLPDDPADRYAAVASRRRRSDHRRTTVLAAALAVVTVAATTSALTWRGSATPSADTFLSATTGARTARVTMTVHLGGQSGRTTGVVDFARHRLRLDSTENGQTSTMLVIGQDTYVSGAVVTFFGAPPGKPWLHLTSGSSVASTSLFDPTEILTALRKQHASVERAGTAVVDGVRTTDYRVTGDVTRGKDTNAVQVGGDGTAHVFVDADGLVRRLALGPDALTLDFTDFGLPVSLEAPPPSQVFEPRPGQSGGITSGVTSGVTGGGGLSTTQRQAVCDAATKALRADTRVPQAQKERLLKTVCG